MLLVNSTLADVSEKEDVSVAALLGVLDRWITTSVDWDALPPCTTLGIDEIALLKGHRDFVAVNTARDDAGDVHVVALLPNRLKTTIVAWLQALPATIRAHITTVCTDMWDGYVTAVEEALPMATMWTVTNALAPGATPLHLGPPTAILEEPVGLVTVPLLDQVRANPQLESLGEAA